MSSQSYGAKATFFITGNNIGKGMINDPSTPYPAVIKVNIWSALNCQMQ
jgi:hypothetical protein